VTESAAAIFSLLMSASVSPDSFSTRDTDLKGGGRKVQHGVDGSGRAALLVPLVDDEIDVTDTASRGITLTTFGLAEAPEGRLLIVRCEDVNLFPTFSLLVDDMVHALSEDMSRPGAVCLRVLGRWRSLLAPNDSALLSEQRQVGLLAELHFLEALFAEGVSDPVASWNGADRARHDFTANLTATEVKATTVRESFPVQIHGALQMEPPVGGQMSLLAFQYERSESGDSISDVVDRLIGRARDPEALLQKLLKSGFNLADSAIYENYRFQTLRVRLCPVNKSFPRIVRSSMIDPTNLDRLSALAYTVDIRAVEGAVPDERALSEAARLMLNA
jgi:hypothetical protein